MFQYRDCQVYKFSTLADSRCLAAWHGDVRIAYVYSIPEAVSAIDAFHAKGKTPPDAPTGLQ